MRGTRALAVGGLPTLLFWFGAGPGPNRLVGPTVGLAGLAVARVLPRAWRTRVSVGAAATGILLLVAAPMLTRPHLSGALTFLALFWGMLLASTVCEVAARRRRGQY
ncbi:hypothetical protein ACFY2R_17360 [Micromonospora olivasterospora]|uniref:Uncharacterized protein n=1 Tax=Micromonospora olivasterospora TaxID=1880 RepID=A0A562II93_MICOL|nr:hypothetical protein [Micromonospora olivasterospora]TWH70324.1 hypothetical protein JD77_05349 [Micromonospora olivasterospora]